MLEKWNQLREHLAEHYVSLLFGWGGIIGTIICSGALWGPWAGGLAFSAWLIIFCIALTD